MGSVDEDLVTPHTFDLKAEVFLEFDVSEVCLERVEIDLPESQRPAAGDAGGALGIAQRQLWGIDMLNVPRSDIPAVTHIDYAARIQTVSPDTNPDHHGLIKKFEERTGCGVIVNTSFNVRGEPIVCTPADAYRCFVRTQIDYLVLGPFLLSKAEQPEWKERRDWRQEFQLD